MPRARANGLELEYDTFGRASDPTLLLVMGYAAQMILWREELCEMLAARGLHVVRYDHRDVGLSTQLDHLGAPDLASVGAAFAQGGSLPAPPYQLSDMAADAVGLLD